MHSQLFYVLRFVSLQKALANRLKNKFKNKRKASSSPPIVAKRSALKSPTYGLPGYLPQVENPPIFDQRKINEMKTDAANDAAVREGMNATFPLRRKQIVKEKTSVKKIKKMYPHLFTESQVRLNRVLFYTKKGFQVFLPTYSFISSRLLYRMLNCRVINIKLHC